MNIGKKKNSTNRVNDINGKRVQESGNVHSLDEKDIFRKPRKEVIGKK